MRRLVHRAFGKAGALSFRIARAAWHPPGEDRTAGWVRDRGDQTLRLDYDLAEASIVFDLGGYEGQWASDIFGRYSPRIHVFEPVPEFAARIEQRFRRNRKISVYRYGLGAKSERLALSVSADASSAFGGERAAGSGPASGSIPIEIVRAADFFTNHEIDRVDLMKINIEGGEYDLLDHLIASGLAARIANIQVQFHDFVPDAARRMESVQRALEATHEVTWQHPFVWENWRLRVPAGA